MKLFYTHLSVPIFAMEANDIMNVAANKMLADKKSGQQYYKVSQIGNERIIL